MKSKKFFLTSLLVLLVLALGIPKISLGYGPIMHTAIGKNAANQISEVEHKDNMESGSELADISAPLKFVLGIEDAERVIHNKDFVNKLFKLATTEQDRSWAAGFLCHHIGDNSCKEFGQACGVSPWSWDNPDASYFEFINDVPAKCKLDHRVPQSYYYNSRLIIEAYQAQGGTENLTETKIKTAVNTLIVGAAAEQAVLACSVWGRALDKPCHCPDICYKKVWGVWVPYPCLTCDPWPCWMWKCTHDDWRSHYDSSVSQTVTEVKNLYGQLTCYDTDEGKNYQEKGTTTGSNGQFADRCINETTVKEFYCDGHEVKFEEHGCPEYCFEERCIKCTDTDGGKNYKIRGTTTGSNGEFTDQCIDNKTLEEFYCEKHEVESVKYRCSEGCFEGKCAKVYWEKIKEFKIQSLSIKQVKAETEVQLSDKAKEKTKKLEKEASGLYLEFEKDLLKKEVPELLERRVVEVKHEKANGGFMATLEIKNPEEWNKFIEQKDTALKEIHEKLEKDSEKIAEEEKTEVEQERIILKVRNWFIEVFSPVGNFFKRLFVR